MNARNFQFIGPSNPAWAIRIADHKLRAKEVLGKAGLPIAATYAALKTRSDVRNFAWESLPNSFVIKPNSGFGGNGIEIVFGKKKNAAGIWIKADRARVTVPQLQQHVYDIIDGMYTMRNAPDDIAMVEERVKIHPVLKPYSFRGIPDIRIIVYNNVPVMAMLRLPTEASHGKANLALGGIGVGIDIASGITTNAIMGKGRPIRTLPNVRRPLAGLAIPCWPKMLAIAVQCQQVTGLKFLGVDIALDKESGPRVLEINARPGLSIQIANMTPLRERLERIQGLNVETLEQGVAIGQSLFTRQVPEGLEALTDKQVVSVFEPITIMVGKGKEHRIMAKLDTGAYSSSIDRALVKKLGITQNIVKEKKAFSSFGEQIRPFIEITFKLKGETITTMASLVDRSQSRYDVLIGRRDLRGFLIDPARKRARGQSKMTQSGPTR